MKHLIQFEAVDEPYYGGSSPVLEITAYPLGYKNRNSLGGVVLELSLRTFGDNLYKVNPANTKSLKAYADAFWVEKRNLIDKLEKAKQK